MTQLLLIDMAPVLLSGRITDPPVLDVHHEGHTVTDGELIVELEERQATEVAIGNFLQDDEQYRVNAFTIESDGTLTAWSREDTGVRSPALPLGATELLVDTLVEAVSYDDSLSPEQQQAYMATIYKARIRIRVRKRGSKPTI